MSRHDDRDEAMRWFETATEDLNAARALAAAGYHAHACFSAQQCAEKAVKAAWFLTGTAPWGHSVQKLLNEFSRKDQISDIEVMIENAIVLDRLYVPTRYPNGLPDLTPEKTYFAVDSEAALGLADAILTTFRNWIAEN